MKEDFLHYIWKFKLFNTSNLLTQDGEIIEIINFGMHNTDAGPDFFNGKVKIGTTTWVGNIELHINSSDWIKHQHQNDKAYDNVVLHVVYNNDKTITDKAGNAIPTIALKDLIDAELINKHKQLIYQSGSDIPCGEQIKTIDAFTINSWLNRLAIERLERKSVVVQELLKKANSDYEAVLFQLLAKNFGLKTNADSFLNLMIPLFGIGYSWSLLDSLSSIESATREIVWL